MNFLLVAGGILQNPTIVQHHIADMHYHSIIAVDRGFDHCMTLGLTPDLLMGDLDSIASPPINCETIAFPPEKDDTDLRLAVDHALSHDATAIDILCATGGRLDQFMGNLSLLEYLHAVNPSCKVRIIDEENFITLISDQTGCVCYPNISKYVSLIPLTEDIIFSGTGLKYPADHLRVTRTRMVSISNESLGTTFTVELHQGKALLIQAG